VISRREGGERGGTRRISRARRHHTVGNRPPHRPLTATAAGDQYVRISMRGARSSPSSAFSRAPRRRRRWIARTTPAGTMFVPRPSGG